MRNHFLLPGHRFLNLTVPVDNLPIVLPPVGVEAAGTVLAAIRMNHKVSPAPGAQQIERTPAEQTVEILRVRPRMAGKVFTFLVGEIRAFFIHNQISPSFVETSNISIIDLCEKRKTKNIWSLGAEKVFVSMPTQIPFPRLFLFCSSLLSRQKLLAEPLSVFVSP